MVVGKLHVYVGEANILAYNRKWLFVKQQLRLYARLRCGTTKHTTQIRDPTGLVFDEEFEFDIREQDPPRIFVDIFSDSDEFLAHMTVDFEKLALDRRSLDMFFPVYRFYANGQKNPAGRIQLVLKFSPNLYHPDNYKPVDGTDLTNTVLRDPLSETHLWDLPDADPLVTPRLYVPPDASEGAGQGKEDDETTAGSGDFGSDEEGTESDDMQSVDGLQHSDEGEHPEDRALDADDWSHYSTLDGFAGRQAGVRAVTVTQGDDESTDQLHDPTVVHPIHTGRGAAANARGIDKENRGPGGAGGVALSSKPKPPGMLKRLANLLPSHESTDYDDNDDDEFDFIDGEIIPPDEHDDLPDGGLPLSDGSADEDDKDNAEKPTDVQLSRRDRRLLPTKLKDIFSDQTVWTCYM